MSQMSAKIQVCANLLLNSKEAAGQQSETTTEEGGGRGKGSDTRGSQPFPYIKA